MPRHLSHTSQHDAHSIISELRHQLRYASQPDEREAIRRELDFWVRFRSNQ